MRLTWKDAVATILVLAGLALGYSVLAGWGWPLMNGVRAGIIGVGVLTFAACPMSWSTSEGASYFKSPFFVMGTIGGVFLLGIGIVGLIVGTAVYLEWMMAVVALMWLMVLVHRLMPRAQAPRAAAI